MTTAGRRSSYDRLLKRLEFEVKAADRALNATERDVNEDGYESYPSVGYPGAPDFPKDVGELKTAHPGVQPPLEVAATKVSAGEPHASAVQFRVRM